MKYKVGDRVRVRRDLEVDGSYGGMEFVLDMVKFKGKTLTIVAAYNIEQVYELEGVMALWTDEMLEEADPECYVKADTYNGCEAFRVSDKNDIDSVIEKVRQALENTLKQKGKFIPKIGEKYWFVSTYGITHSTTNDDANDKYILNSGPVFRTEEEAEDYKLFKEQVAELREPFIPHGDNYCFYYDYENKRMSHFNWTTSILGALIFGHTIEEFEKAREILGDDRIKKYLLDVWE